VAGSLHFSKPGCNSIGSDVLNSRKVVYTDISDEPSPAPLDFAEQLISIKKSMLLIIDNCPPDVHQKLLKRCNYMKMEGMGKQIGGSGTFYMTIKNDHYKSQEILGDLKTIINGVINPNDFLHEDKIRSEKKNYEYKIPKYDRYVPNGLLKRQVIEDYIDISFIKEQVDTWTACDNII